MFTFDEAYEQFMKYNIEHTRIWRKMLRASRAEKILAHKLDSLFYERHDIIDKSSAEYIQNRKLHDKLTVAMHAAINRKDNFMFECDLLEIHYEYFLDIMNRYDIDDEKSAPNILKISRAKRGRLEKELCAICLDTHNYKDLIKTSCGHIFGKCCYNSHMNTLHGERCPMCRTCSPSIYVFGKKIIYKRYKK